MPRPKLQDTAATEYKKSTSVFVIGCGGHTEAKYFEQLVRDRDDVKVETLPPKTQKESPKAHSLSSPLQTVERVSQFWEKFEPEEGDQVWILLDVDHHFEGGHQTGTSEALSQAEAENYKVVISNPCFEVWLALHREEMLPVLLYTDCKALEKHFHTKWPGYHKTKLDIETYRPHIREAMSRAGRLRAGSTTSPPPNPGTEVETLMEALDAACGENKVF